MDTQNVKSGQNGQTDDVKFVKLVNESEILNDIEYGIRETEKMIRDIDIEFKKLNDNLAINKQTEKQELNAFHLSRCMIDHD